MKYGIYHSVGLNTQCERGKFEYNMVTEVEATSLEDSFKAAQNDFNPKYKKLGIRSTSVGDIISDPEGELFMVKNIGFEPVPETVVQYVDWSNH